MLNTHSPAKTDKASAAMTETLRRLVSPQGQDSEKRRYLIRKLANEVVALRERFEVDGRPDWAGRSQDYRDEIYAIYRDAGVPLDEIDRIQAGIRYHVADLVRSAAPPGDLTG